MFDGPPESVSGAHREAVVDTPVQTTGSTTDRGVIAVPVKAISLAWCWQDLTHRAERKPSLSRKGNELDAAGRSSALHRSASGLTFALGRDNLDHLDGVEVRRRMCSGTQREPSGSHGASTTPIATRRERGSNRRVVEDDDGPLAETRAGAASVLLDWEEAVSATMR